MRLAVGLEAAPGVVLEGEGRGGGEVHLLAGDVEDELALLVLAQGPEARGLAASAGDGLGLEAVLQVDEELGGGDDAVAAGGHEVGAALQGFEEGHGEGGVGAVAPAGAQATGQELVGGGLVVGGGGEDLPGGVVDEAVVALLVHDPGRREDVAHGRPAEGAGEATVQYHEHVPARERHEGVVQAGHL